MSNPIVSVKPQWGVNYRVGYVGFSYYDTSFVSNGIAWFTQWDRKNNPPVSHTFIVTGEDSVVEAQSKGVVQAGLKHYFTDQHCHVFFREVQGYTDDVGKAIATAGAGYIGYGYGYSLILAHALHGTIMGQAFSWLTRGWSTRTIAKFLDNKKQAICSEHVSMSLNDVPATAHKGILAQKLPAEITPQMLAWDEVLFKVFSDPKP